VRRDPLQRKLLVVLLVLHVEVLLIIVVDVLVLVVLLLVALVGVGRYPPEGDSVGHLDVLVLIVAAVRVRVGNVALGILCPPVVLGLLDDAVGPLDVSVFGRGGGGLRGAADRLVEPHLLFPLGFGEVEHQGVEEVGVSDEEAQVVIWAASLRRELGPSLVGEEVCLCNRHLLG